VVALAALMSSRCQADTNGVLTILYSFSNGADGSVPQAALLQASDGNFYGTTQGGGVSPNCDGGCGTVFQITTDGTLTTIYNFTNGPEGYTVSEALVQGLDGGFYGATVFGGTGTDCWQGCGAVFKITSEGTLTTLHNFSGSDGGNPSGGLVLGSDGNFYGTTEYGGITNQALFPGGTVYQITPQGTLTTLYYFTGGADGGVPDAALVQGADGWFYGVTAHGGNTNCISGCGTVFKISSEGTFTTLHQFDGADGAYPQAGLMQASNGNFYGTAQSHGPSGWGTAYRISPSGTLTVMHAFGDPGIYPQSVLLQCVDSNFYGTTFQGGPGDDVNGLGGGTIFQLTPAGGYTALFYFDLDINGDEAGSGLIQGGDGNFYGTTLYGGTYGAGIVYRLGCIATPYADGGTFNPEGGISNVLVSTSCTNCPWVAESDDSFITIANGARGSFTGVVQYSVASNQSTSARGGSLTIGGQSLTIFQYGIPCVLVLEETNASFDATGGAGSVVFDANGSNCQWTAQSSSPWIAITSGSTPCAGQVCPITPGLFCGCGNGTVTYSIDANTSSAQRVGTLAVAGETYTVTQAGSACTVSLGATNASFGPSGGSGKIQVTGSASTCTWSAISNDAFITITAGATTSGPGTITYVVSPNTNGVELTGSISVANQTFTVNQTFEQCALSVSPTRVKLNANGGTKKAHVKTRFANCQWSAVSNDPFITITAGPTGLGKGAFTYSVATNSTTMSRTGTVAVAGETITIVQSAERPKR
jgi:uncharacterized repeat protein (TIGR03803 family)